MNTLISLLLILIKINRVLWLKLNTNKYNSTSQPTDVQYQGRKIHQTVCNNITSLSKCKINKSYRRVFINKHQKYNFYQTKCYIVNIIHWYLYEQKTYIYAEIFKTENSRAIHQLYINVFCNIIHYI